MATAAAQSGMNRDTAVSQQLINMTSQHNPWGNVDYNQSGTTGYTDSTGKYVTIPQYTQTTTLSPDQQPIFDKAQAAESNLAGIAQDQSKQVADTLATPFSFNNSDADKWAYDLGQERIAPQQQEATTALQDRLVNSGIRPGTQAWDSEMRRLTSAQTDQNNQLALSGRSQAFGEATATRNQPINELTALMSQSQVSDPAHMSAPTPQASVGGVDYSGLVQSNYQQQLAQSNAMMGGLFGLAGTGAHLIPGFQ